MSEIDVAIAHLKASDPDYARFLESAPRCTLDEPLHESELETLIFAIIGQQISVKAADAITFRLIDAVGRPVTAESIISLGQEGLHSLGFTKAKARTSYELSQAILDGTIDFQHLKDLDDDAAVAYLSQLWGIGRWTSEMFLMFRQGRLDHWPTGDIAVRRGFAQIKKLDSIPTPEAMESMADHLRPYRSVAAWYCWVALRDETNFW